MSSYGPNNGWACSECGAFNDCTDYACRCQHEQDDREQLRWEKTRNRWGFQDELIARSEFGNLKYRARRYVGGRVKFLVIGPDPSLSYAVEWYRVPSSVRWQATAYFSR